MSRVEAHNLIHWCSLRETGASWLWFLIGAPHLEYLAISSSGFYVANDFTQDLSDPPFRCIAPRRTRRFEATSTPDTAAGRDRVRRGR